ncbi:MAG: hypothetical protein H7Y04_04660 [Verrucomicrobia bacterium]|nr:hypothetical protein [Cytophagales bacterium]
MKKYKKFIGSLCCIALLVSGFSPLAAQKITDYFPVDETSIYFYRCIDKTLDLNYTWKVTQIDNCNGNTCAFFELKQQPGNLITPQGKKPLVGGSKVMRYFSFSDKETVLKNITNYTANGVKGLTTFPNQTYLRIPKTMEKPYMEDVFIGEDAMTITVEHKNSVNTFKETYNEVLKMTAILEGQRGMISKEEVWFAKNVGLVARKVYKANGHLDPYQSFELEKVEKIK